MKIGKMNKNEKGQTALETAIILIAFVVVAAVFAFTILSAGTNADNTSCPAGAPPEPKANTCGLLKPEIGKEYTIQSPEGQYKVTITDVTFDDIKGYLEKVEHPTNGIFQYIDLNTGKDNVTYDNEFVGGIVIQRFKGAINIRFPNAWIKLQKQ